MTDFDTQVPDCHFITVAEIRDEYEGSLAAYLAKTGARNVIITMEVRMSVSGGAPRPHSAALAVSHDYSDSEELITMARQFFPKNSPFAFGWVPANLYGTEKFGIFVDQGEVGELLANGLIDEIIQSVGVEQAVAG